MNFRPVLQLVSYLPLVLAAGMAICFGTAIFLEDPGRAKIAFGSSMMLSACVGLALWWMTRGPIDLNRRDGVGVVALGWIFSTILGAVPLRLGAGGIGWADAWFESVSGFTTTGATIFVELEALPRSILLWRAISQFIGGMGILVLCVAILPLLGSGGMQIYRAEMAGPSKDRLTPRIATTAKLLWGLYVGFTIAVAVLLHLAGMSLFEAVCHALTTVSTGGFSTRTASIGAYSSPAIVWILTAAMFLAGTNFALHWKMLRGEWNSWFRDPEWRLYATITLLAVLFIAANAGVDPTGMTAATVGHVLFTVVSIFTSTGFTTIDYGQWPAFSQYALLALMVVGGCAGSTAGGIKVIRLLVLTKLVTRELKLFIQPQAIFPVKIGRQVVDPEIVSMIAAFFVIFALLGGFAAALITIWIPDIRTAVSAVISCLSNIGPGLGSVGPSGTYAIMPGPAKLLLSLCMLMGRLELYTLLVLLIPNFWRR